MARSGVAPQNEELRRLRPFRVAAYSTYLVVAVGFSLLILVNVTRSVIAMTPSRPPPSGALLPAQACVQRGRVLWTELDGRRRALSDYPVARAVGKDWSRFRIDWLTRLRALEANCGVDREDRRALRRVFTRLNKLLDLYTTHVVQYAGEIGPTVDALRADLDAGVGNGLAAPEQ